MLDDVIIVFEQDLGKDVVILCMMLFGILIELGLVVWIIVYLVMCIVYLCQMIEYGIDGIINEIEFFFIDLMCFGVMMGIDSLMLVFVVMDVICSIVQDFVLMGFLVLFSE